MPSTFSLFPSTSNLFDNRWVCRCVSEGARPSYGVRSNSPNPPRSAPQVRALDISDGQILYLNGRKKLVCNHTAYRVLYLHENISSALTLTPPLLLASQCDGDFDVLVACQLHIEQERSLEEKIRLLQNQLETEQVECRRLQWAHKDAAKEKDLELQKYE